MNINSSLPGTEASMDRVFSSNTSPARPTKATAASNEPNPSFQANQSYTHVTDLKLAELRGENHTISDEQLVKAIERAIKSMQGKATNLEFSIHEKTKLIAVKVKDSETGEVIREIPPEKSLDFVAKLWEMAGIFVDEKR